MRKRPVWLRSPWLGREWGRSILQVLLATPPLPLIWTPRTYVFRRMDAPWDLHVVAFHGLFLNAGRVSWEASGAAGVKPLIIPCRVNSSPCSSLYTYTSHMNTHHGRVTRLSVFSQDHIGMIKSSAEGQSQLGDIYSGWRGINLLNKLNLNSAKKKKNTQLSLIYRTQ